MTESRDTKFTGPEIDAERGKLLHDAVRRRYRTVSESPENKFRYPVGRESALHLGYDGVILSSIAGEIVNRFVGVGNPFRIQSPGLGDEVLDLGCGRGFDVFFAAFLVGPAGRAVGVDLTPEMLTWPRRHAASMRIVQFEEADLTSLPFADCSFDLVTSNGVLNLVPDKKTALQEVHRVLRPGGRFVAADLIVIETIPDDVLSDTDAWST